MVAQFERANQVIANKNYGYAITLLMSCCKIDPGNITYRQRLRQTQRAKYGTKSGSMFAGVTNWPARMKLKTALKSGKYLNTLEFGEKILSRSPWDVGTQMDMAQAADALGQLDLAVWCLEQARIKATTNVALNRALAELYERRGNFTQAIALWHLVTKAQPRDEYAQKKLKDLAVHETIQRGQYEAVAPGAEGTPAAPDAQDKDAAKPGQPATRPGLKPGSSPKHPVLNAGGATGGPAERLAREAGGLKSRIEADPANVNSYLQLASLYRRADHLDDARAVLQQGLDPTGNAWELTIELADLEIETFRRNLAVTEGKLKAKPDAEDLKKMRNKLLKEITSRELEVHRRKADRYPTEMVHRYEVGVRLLRLGKVDEAIKELQQARNDPRHKWQALVHLGHCFKARNNWRLAQRNFEEALQDLPPSETDKRKELLYEIAQGCATASDFKHAVEVAQELANLDFTYRDIGRLLDEWETAASR
jgi:tetratricopeptide (TPR) repeat protein